MTLPPVVFELLAHAQRVAMRQGPDALAALSKLQETAFQHASRVRVRFDVALVLDLDGDPATADRGAVRLSGSVTPAGIVAAQPSSIRVTRVQALHANEAATVGV